MRAMIPVKLADAKTNVRNPNRSMRLLKAGGELVPGTTYWRRRIAAGDVVEIPEADWTTMEADKASAARKADEAKAAADKAAAAAEAAKTAGDAAASSQTAATAAAATVAAETGATPTKPAASTATSAK